MTWIRYHRYNDMVRYMEFLVYTFPDLVELVTIGHSTNGLPLKVLKISMGSRNQSKPAVWINGGISAREWISPSVVLYIARQLVERYNSNRQIVHNADWYLMAVANPDGYEFSHLSDRLWIKTRSTYDKSLSNLLLNGRSCEGVDLYRNFDFHWGEAGASDDPCSQNYAGPRPLSEPESRAIANFLTDRKDDILVFINLQAYSQKWLVPSSFGTKTDDYKDMINMAKRAVQRLTEFQVEAIQALSSGAIEDWAKGSIGIKYTYRVELRDQKVYGYILPHTKIIPTARETFHSIRSLIKSLVSKT